MQSQRAGSVLVWGLLHLCWVQPMLYRSLTACEDQCGTRAGGRRMLTRSGGSYRLGVCQTRHLKGQSFAQGSRVLPSHFDTNTGKGGHGFKVWGLEAVTTEVQCALLHQASFSAAWTYNFMALSGCETTATLMRILTCMFSWEMQ